MNLKDPYEDDMASVERRRAAGGLKDPHEDDMGLFGGPLGEQAPKLDAGQPAPYEGSNETDDEAQTVAVAAAVASRNPGNKRRALRQLQDLPPSDFEKVIDILYEWSEHCPVSERYPGGAVQITDLMRKLLSQNHNMNDQQAIAAMEGLIREARKAKIDEAITKMGLDAAEKILGLREDEP